MFARLCWVHAVQDKAAGHYQEVVFFNAQNKSNWGTGSVWLGRFFNRDQMDQKVPCLPETSGRTFKTPSTVQQTSFTIGNRIPIGTTIRCNQQKSFTSITAHYPSFQP